MKRTSYIYKYFEIQSNLSSTKVEVTKIKV